jgi:hypothetical protein
VCVVAEALEEIQHAFVEHGVPANQFFEAGKLIRRWQLTVKQQPADLHEAGVFRKLLDRITPVHENTLFTIDEGNVRFTAARCNEARIVSEYAVLPVQTCYIDKVGTGRTAANRQLGLDSTGAYQPICVLAHDFPLSTSLRTGRA